MDLSCAEATSMSYSTRLLKPHWKGRQVTSVDAASSSGTVRRMPRQAAAPISSRTPDSPPPRLAGKLSHNK